MSTNMALPTTADSFDLSSSSLKFLSLLMLAQAASCAFEKAVCEALIPNISYDLYWAFAANGYQLFLFLHIISDDLFVFSVN